MIRWSSMWGFILLILGGGVRLFGCSEHEFHPWFSFRLFHPEPSLTPHFAKKINRELTPFANQGFNNVVLAEFRDSFARAGMQFHFDLLATASAHLTHHVPSQSLVLSLPASPFPQGHPIDPLIATSSAPLGWVTPAKNTHFRWAPITTAFEKFDGESLRHLFNFTTPLAGLDPDKTLFLSLNILDYSREFFLNVDYKNIGVVGFTLESRIQGCLVISTSRGEILDFKELEVHSSENGIFTDILGVFYHWPRFKLAAIPGLELSHFKEYKYTIEFQDLIAYAEVLHSGEGGR